MLDTSAHIALIMVLFTSIEQYATEGGVHYKLQKNKKGERGVQQK